MNVYITADIHGSFKPVRDFAQRYPKLSRDYANGEENILILLGDFGGNFFFNYQDDNFKKKLVKYPITTYFVIRGNHEQRPMICASENPDCWHTETYFNNTVYVENKYPYIKYALDWPAEYNINGYKTLVVPGAYSIDKYYRLQNNLTWFPYEQLTEYEMDLGRCVCEQYEWNFDLVLSHTCPIIYEPTDLFLNNIDQSMVDKSMERYLGELEYRLNYKLFCWGHYHQTRIYPNTDDKQPLMLMNDVINLNEWMEKLPNEIGKLI